LEKDEDKIFYNNSNNFKQKNQPQSIESNFLANIKMYKDSTELNFVETKEINKKTNFTINELYNKPWLVTRYSYSNNELGFKLHEGDYIKIGKVIFKVKEIYIMNNRINNKEKLYDRTFIDPLRENVSENIRERVNPNNLFTNNNIGNFQGNYNNYNNYNNFNTENNLRIANTNHHINININPNAYRENANANENENANVDPNANADDRKLILKENKGNKKRM
jgi:hypothetical protein